MCLGLPKFVANAVLYKESRIPSLETRFKILTVQTFLRIYESTLRRDQYIFIRQPDLFFRASWSRGYVPQVVVTQTSRPAKDSSHRHSHRKDERRRLT